MDEDNNPIIKNTGDINIDTRTYFQKETQNITQNGDYIYEQNENGAWHLESKPQDSTEPTDVKIEINKIVYYDPTKFIIRLNGTSQNYYINKQPIDWTYELSGNNVWALVMNNDVRNAIQFHIVLIEDGTSRLLKVDDTVNATGNYCYECTGAAIPDSNGITSLDIFYDGDFISYIYLSNNSNNNPEESNIFFNLPRSQTRKYQKERR
jgi:hypothetical protein